MLDDRASLYSATEKGQTKILGLQRELHCFAKCKIVSIRCGQDLNFLTGNDFLFPLGNNPQALDD